MKSLTVLALLLPMLVWQLNAAKNNNGTTLDWQGACTPEQISAIYDAVLAIEQQGIWDDEVITTLNPKLVTISANDCSAKRVSKTKMEAAAAALLKPKQDKGELKNDWPYNSESQILRSKDGTFDLKPNAKLTLDQLKEEITKVMGEYRAQFLALFEAAHNALVNDGIDKLKEALCKLVGKESPERCVAVLTAQIAFEESADNTGTSYLFLRAGDKAPEKIAHECSIPPFDPVALDNEMPKKPKSFGYSLTAGALYDEGACALRYAGILETSGLTKLLLPQADAHTTMWFFEVPYFLTLFGNGEFWHPRSKMRQEVHECELTGEELGFGWDDTEMTQFADDFFYAADKEDKWIQMNQLYTAACTPAGHRFKQSHRAHKSFLKA